MGNYDSDNVDPRYTNAHHFLVLISITLQRFCNLGVGFWRDLMSGGTFILQIYRVEICVRIHGNGFGRNLKREDSFRFTTPWPQGNNLLSHTLLEKILCCEPLHIYRTTRVPMIMRSHVLFYRRAVWPAGIDRIQALCLGMIYSTRTQSHMHTYHANFLLRTRGARCARMLHALLPCNSSGWWTRSHRRDEI